MKVNEITHLKELLKEHGYSRKAAANIVKWCE